MLSFTPWGIIGVGILLYVLCGLIAIFDIFNPEYAHKFTRPKRIVLRFLIILGWPAIFASMMVYIIYQGISELVRELFS